MLTYAYILMIHVHLWDCGHCKSANSGRRLDMCWDVYVCFTLHVNLYVSFTVKDQECTDTSQMYVIGTKDIPKAG